MLPMTEQSSSLVFKNHGLKWNNSNDVKDITKQIDECENLISLTLTGSSLGYEAAESIAKSLLNKSTLKHIYMSDLFTGRDKYEIPKVLDCIFDAILQSKAKIETLDLSDNAFGPHGMKALTKFLSNAFSLKILILNNNGLGSLGSELLSEALITCYKNKTNEPLKLIELHCGRNRLEDEGAKNISKIIKCIDSLRILRMPQNGIQHKGVTELCMSLNNNPYLECLDLNDNIVTEIGAKSLGNFLQQLNHLVELDLGDCLLRDGGGLYLTEALNMTKSPINKLNITYNELGFHTVKSIVIAVSRKQHNLSLLIDGNMIGKRGRRAICDLLDNHSFITYDNLENDESTDEENSDNEPSEGISMVSEFNKMQIN